MRKKNVVRVELFIEKNQWVAAGPRLRVEAPTLQAARRRIRKAAEEAYGVGVELESSLRLPLSLTDRIDRYKQRKETLDLERRTLRLELAAILHVLRNDLGGSYEDAASLLGVDAAALMRTVHSTQSLSLEKDDD